MPQVWPPLAVVTLAKVRGLVGESAPCADSGALAPSSMRTTIETKRPAMWVPPTQPVSRFAPLEALANHRNLAAGFIASELRANMHRQCEPGQCVRHHAANRSALRRRDYR